MIQNHRVSESYCSLELLHRIALRDPVHLAEAAVLELPVGFSTPYWISRRYNARTKAIELPKPRVLSLASASAARSCRCGTQVLILASTKNLPSL